MFTKIRDFLNIIVENPHSQILYPIPLWIGDLEKIYWQKKYPTSVQGHVILCNVWSDLSKQMYKHGGCRPSMFVQYLFSASETNMRPNSAKFRGVYLYSYWFLPMIITANDLKLKKEIPLVHYHLILFVYHL